MIAIRYTPQTDSVPSFVADSEMHLVAAGNRTDRDEPPIEKLRQSVA
jgi:hypothetical protein